MCNKNKEAFANLNCFFEMKSKLYYPNFTDHSNIIFVLTNFACYRVDTPRTFSVHFKNPCFLFLHFHQNYPPTIYCSCT